MEQRSKEDSLLSDVVYSRNVIEFVTVANEFCTFTESVNDLQRGDFLGKLQKMLPLLYLKASLLPAINELDDSEDSPEKFVTESDYNFILRKLSSKMGEFDSYPEIFEPGITLGEANVEANISENVADIYQDLKDFVLLYQKPLLTSKENSVRDCRYLFETRTGTALVHAHQVIHSLMYREIP